MASFMVLTYLFYCFFFFVLFFKFRQFPVRDIYKTKINIEESSERKLTEKNFCVVSSRARRHVNSRRKSFCINFNCAFFLHCRVETSGKLKAKHKS